MQPTDFNCLATRSGWDALDFRPGSCFKRQCRTIKPGELISIYFHSLRLVCFPGCVLIHEALSSTMLSNPDVAKATRGFRKGVVEEVRGPARKQIAGGEREARGQETAGMVGSVDQTYRFLR